MSQSPLSGSSVSDGMATSTDGITFTSQSPLSGSSVSDNLLKARADKGNKTAEVSIPFIRV